MNSLSEERVRRYYAAHAKDEWNRMFTSKYARLEFDTTLHFLEKYLPKKGLILDAGGGPGRYTVELSRRGYDLVLLDLVPENLEFAKKKLKAGAFLRHVTDFVEGSIEDMSMFPSESFDGVLCLGGPLSHLLNANQRKRAARELIRVAKVDAPILVSVINKFSMLLYELMGQYVLRKRDGEELFRRILKKGDYLGEHVFTAFHGYTPEELREVFSEPQIKVLEMAGLEGLGAHHQGAINNLAKNRKLWRLWLEAHYQTCSHPAVQAMSEHCLLVGRKRLKSLDRPAVDRTPRQSS